MAAPDILRNSALLVLLLTFVTGCGGSNSSDDTTSVAVDIANIRAFVSVDDNSYNSFVAAYGVLGMLQDVHYREISGAAARGLLLRLTRFTWYLPKTFHWRVAALLRKWPFKC